MPYGLTYQQMLSVWNRINIILDDDSCWEWQGATKKDSKWPYGIVRLNKRNYRVHRLVYAQIFGEFDRKLFVCHTCDNPKCARPSHLFLADVAGNNRDKEAKGRGNQPRGLANGKCKISDEQVREMRQLRVDGWLQKDLARKFDVDASYVSQIISRRRRPYA